MLNYLKKVRFTFLEKAVLLSVFCFLLIYWWGSSRVWFRIDNHNVVLNGRPLSDGNDYSCFKSLSRDVLCHHQDHGAQYLISPRRREVSIISEKEDVDLLDVVLYSYRPLSNLDESNGRKSVPDAGLMVGDDLIKFVGIHGEEWHISY